MMGAGKTSVGKRLAKKLDLPFVDSDQEVEAAAGMSVADIFAAHGEDAFRDGERRVIARLLDEAPQVVAFGGGAFAHDETRALALKAAVVVWLDADVETLLERTGRRDTRPLLKTGDPRRILTDLKAARDPIYAQAHIRITSGAVPLNTLVDRVADAVRAAWKERP